jgi:ribosomal protein S18 acetylase RimI-like enzyme
VNAFYAGTKPLDEKIEHCERVYAEADLPSLFRITPFAPPALDAALEARGYERIDHTLQQLTRLNRPLPSAPAGVAFRSMILEDWLEAAASLRQQSEAARDAEFRRLHHGEVPGYCMLAYAGDEAVACGLVMKEQEFATLMDIHVAENWRGRGVGTAISAALLSIARRNGAETAWLNVLANNGPAVRTYARLGFETLYEYWYRVKSSADGVADKRIAADGEVASRREQALKDRLEVILSPTERGRSSSCQRPCRSMESAVIRSSADDLPPTPPLGSIGASPFERSLSVRTERGWG